MNRKAMLYLTGLAAAAATLPPAIVRFGKWQQNWGATEDETLRVMPGDDRVEDPEYVRTRAITVDASPEDIYPWLVQMGKGRGGLYSWDFLDRLFGFLDAPSAKVILPEWQALKPGDEIPIGRGGNFPVVDLKANEFLYLGGDADGSSWTWTTALYRTEDGQTRLVTRNTGKGGAFGKRFFMAGMDLAAFVMVHRWLHVLKARAEGLRRQRSETAPPVEAA
jgi:hypothetical protein